MSQNGNRFFILRHFIGWVKENEEWNFLLFIVEASERSAFHRMSYKKNPSHSSCDARNGFLCLDGGNWHTTKSFACSDGIVTA